jgi:hypothetical protein
MGWCWASQNGSLDDAEVLSLPVLSPAVLCQILGKVNTISLDKCSRTGLVFDDVIATVEVVNCNSVQVQCKGSLPTMSIDKCDGCQLFITKAVAGNPDFQVGRRGQGGRAPEPVLLEQLLSMQDIAGIRQLQVSAEHKCAAMLHVQLRA